VESNFQESIEELSPIRKNDKSLEKSNEKSNEKSSFKESPRQKEFNLREKHEEKLKKLREEKSKENLNKSNSAVNVKSRLNTKESEKSIDKISMIKQKHQNRKEYEEKIREEN